MKQVPGSALLMTIFIAGFTSLASSPASCQAVASAIQGAVTSSVMQREISVQLSNVLLSDALREVQRLGNLQIAYAREDIPKNAHVTLSSNRITVGDALSSLLKGTGLKMITPVADRIAIVKESPQISVRQGQGVVAGKVTDAKSGKGIVGATVSIGSDSRSAVTGDNGMYRITGVLAGTHVISVRLVGFSKQTRSITIGAGASVQVDFKLEQGASVLDQVIVTGTIVQTELKAVPSAVTVITAKQLEQRGIVRIEQLFRGDIPGLFALERGTDAPLDEVIMFSRGATKLPGSGSGPATTFTNPIKTYVDGVEMADPQYISQIDPRSIERIEILTGPQASTIYGANAINGVMQIFTKRGSLPKPAISMSVQEGWAQNNFNRSLASSHFADGSIAGLEGRVSYNVGSSWNYTGAWTPSRQTQRTSIYGGGRYQASILTMDFTARKGWTQNKIIGSASQLITELAAEGKYNSFSGLTAPSKRALTGQTLGVTLGYAPVSWWSHQINAGSDVSDTESLGTAVIFSSFSDTALSNSQNKNSRTSQSYSSTLSIPASPAIRATLTYGADHWRNNTSSASWSTVGQTISSPSVTRNKPRKNGGAYLQGQVGVQDALFLTYGLRADWNPNYGNKATVRPGRYGIAYSRELGNLTAKVRGSYGRSIRPPEDGLTLGTLGTAQSRREVFGNPYYSTLPNPDLGPEFQQGGEGGIELYTGNRGSLVVTYYNQTVDGLIYEGLQADSIRALLPGPAANGLSSCQAEFLRSDGYCYLLQNKPVNIGSIRNRGWELQGGVNAGPFTTRGTYTWAKSRVIGVTERYRPLAANAPTFQPGQTFNYAPEHTWAFNLAYVRSASSISLNINGIGTILRNVSSGNSRFALVTGQSLRIRFRDALRFDNPSGFTFRFASEGYTMADLNGAHRFSDKVEATLQVTNLTNFYQNDVGIFFPTLGRQTRLGARIKL